MQDAINELRTTHKETLKQGRPGIEAGETWAREVAADRELERAARFGKSLEITANAAAYRVIERLGIAVFGDEDGCNRHDAHAWWEDATGTSSQDAPLAFVTGFLEGARTIHDAVTDKMG